MERLLRSELLHGCAGHQQGHEGGGVLGRLDGKSVLITGAGAGIGRAAALLFASEGAQGRRRRDRARARRGDRGGDQGGGRRGDLSRDRRQQACERRGGGLGHGQRVRRPGRALQQCRRRHARRRQGDRDRDRGVLAHDRRRSARHVPGLPLRAAGDGRARRRLDHQHHLGARPDRHRRRRCLQRRQGRRAGAHQGARPAMGARATSASTRSRRASC